MYILNRTMEKIPRGSAEYFLIEKEYNNLVTNITREKDFKGFIGGLPVTLERKDIFTILSKDSQANYRYSVTQKVDGTRLLMFANFKKKTGLRNITFIDRNNEFYTFKNKSRDSLPDFSGPKILIDGELIIINNENEVTSTNDKYFNIKMFSFMAFDILYGPISIEYSGPPDNKRLNIGSEGAMAGPIGGKMWPYQKRYDILYQLLVPNLQNDFRPILSLAFKDCKWFVPEIKPIYYINSLKDTSKKLYEANNSRAFFQANLIEFRKIYYELLNNYIRTTQTNHAELINISLDGLIFTPFDTEYVISGPWKKFLNTQYKWKPTDEQSIDFAIFKEGKNYVLKIKKGKNLVIFTVKKGEHYVPAEITEESSLKLSGLKIKNNTIGEFIYDIKKSKFVLLRLRIDKETPNSLSTAINVINAIKNPVNLEIIKKFLFINKLNLQGIKELLKYMSKSQMLRCMINSKKIEIFNEEVKKQIYGLIDNFKKDNGYEFEIRFGIIEPSKFQTNIPFNLYRQVIDVTSYIYKTVKYDYSVLYDFYKDSVRTRYLYLDDLKTIIKLASIKKEPIENINIDLKYIYNLDLRYALSNEKPDTKIVTKENANLILEKKRHSFNFDDSFSLDLTEIIKINKDSSGKETKEAPKFQVELEIKNRLYSNDILYNKINAILINILSLINS